MSKLHDFTSATDGSIPQGGLVLSGSTLIGTAGFGGVKDTGGGSGEGTIWSFDTANDLFNNLHDFSGADGISPVGGAELVGEDIIGVTMQGGSSGGGTLWSFSMLNNTFTTLHDFSGAAEPDSGLDSAGSTVFGTTSLGGAWNSGTLWSYDNASDTFMELYHFNKDTDGFTPQDVELVGTTVFGTSRSGGANDDGTLWSFETQSNTFTKLHDFGGKGVNPTGQLAIVDTKVFGITTAGSQPECFLGCGSLWSFDTADETFTTLHEFDYDSGMWPYGGVSQVGSSLYGTATYAGANSGGTLWSFDPMTETFTKLHDFQGAADGDEPRGTLVISGDTLYGTASRGGAFDVGTIWSFQIPEPSCAFMGSIGLVMLMVASGRRLRV